MSAPVPGEVKVFGPEESPSYWQPVPANGFVRNLLNTARAGAVADFSMGTQTVAPGCFIREHTHEHQEEVIHLLDGRGVARVEGADTPMTKGTTVFICEGQSAAPRISPWFGGWRV